MAAKPSSSPAGGVAGKGPQAASQAVGGGGGGGAAPPQIVPGLQAGDVMALMTMLQSLGGGSAFSQLAGQFPGGELIGQTANWMQGGPPPTAQALVGAVIESQPMLGPMGSSVISSAVSQGLPLLKGIQTPTATLQNLTSMLQSFGLSGGGGLGALAAPMVAMMAASAMFQNVTSPFLVPASAEMQLLLTSFQNVMGLATSAMAAGQMVANPLMQLLQANQQLTNQLLQANQLFAPAAALMSAIAPLTTAMNNPLLSLFGQLSSTATSPMTFGNPLAPLTSLTSGMSQIAAQVNQGFALAQSQIQSMIQNPLLGLQMGLPVLGATAAVIPGVLPFNLINAMTGMLLSPMSQLGASALSGASALLGASALPGASPATAPPLPPRPASTAPPTPGQQLKDLAPTSSQWQSATPSGSGPPASRPSPPGSAPKPASPPPAISQHRVGQLKVQPPARPRR